MIRLRDIFLAILIAILITALIFWSADCLAGEIDPFVIQEIREDIQRSEDRIHQLEAEVERMHGVINAGKWLVGVVGLFGAAVTPFILSRRGHK